ncbi:hypothetical protein DPMN_071815 [Dreissena polymorpha]|uniref:Uncharacterized protein n=1 Tax=Dreissena polymorpha TaxID=45954 RepID=A0A9D3Z7F8_DREPO|nr:hypothetical protein DPMN_071815 [Dreissena polymorpha]
MYAKPLEGNVECTSGRVWFLLHQPVCKQNKSGKVRIDCTVKYRGISPNNNRIQGHDLVNSLEGVFISSR